MQALYSKREKGRRRVLKYASQATFKSYIRDLLHMMFKDSSISEQSLAIIDSMIQDMFKELATEAKHLMLTTGKRTLMAWDVQAAVRECLRGEVARHAVSEGAKAVETFAGALG